MGKLNKEIEEHYFTDRLFEDIVNRLTNKGIDLSKVERSDIAGVDEFHVRGAVVSKELASSINLEGVKVLDVGSGLGGPCRMLASDYDCIVTGIDLSHEYVRTAKKLSKLVKLDHKTSFSQGDATHLPFEDESFDVVWTQHVQMNIPDKQRFYNEIHRVLKTGGYFLFYDIFKKDENEVSYPMPWASNANQSFLFKTSELEDLLKTLGQSKVNTNDQTAAGIDFFESMIANMKPDPNRLGLNLLMGESTKPKLMNLMQHLKKGALELQSGVYLK